MTDRSELLLEAERRGILPEREQGFLTEARNRGIFPSREDTQGSPGLISVIKGEGRASQGMPELSTELRKRLNQSTFRDPQNRKAHSNLRKAILATDLPTGPAGKIQALRNAGILDDAFDVDDEGLPLVTLDGQQFAINSPGLTQQDFRELGTDILVEAPLVFPLARLGQATLGVIGRVGGTATGIATGSALRDVAAGVSPDIGRAGLAGGAGAAAEAFIPVFGKVFRKLISRSDLVDLKNMELTDKGKKFLENAGVDPESVDAAYLNALSQTRFVDDPKIAARQAEAQSLPVPVESLSRGELTGDPVQSALEDSARKGVFGEDVKGAALAAREQSETALRANREAIQEQLGPETITGPGAGIESVQEGLETARGALRQEAADTFTGARGQATSVLTEGVDAVGRALTRGLRQAAHNPRLAPKAFAFANDLLTVRRRFPGRVTSVKLNALENWRQQVSRLARGSDSTEAAAAGQLIRDYDNLVREGLDDALIRGDRDAVLQYRNAGKLWRRLKTQFDEDNIVTSIIERTTVGDEVKFALPPSEALNKIFTVNSLGSKRGAVRALERIKNILGSDSAEWGAMKQEGFLRLFAKQPDEGFDAAAFVGSMRDAFKKSPELMTVLFDKGERALLSRFASVASRLKTPKITAANFSNTANLGAILDQFGFIGRQTRRFLTRRFEGAAGAAARQGIESPVRALPPGAPGARGLIGGAAGGAIPESIGNN